VHWHSITGKSIATWIHGLTPPINTSSAQNAMNFGPATP